MAVVWYYRATWCLGTVDGRVGCHGGRDAERETTTRITGEASEGDACDKLRLQEGFGTEANRANASLGVLKERMVCWCADSGRIGLALMRSDSPRIGANRPDSPGNCWAVMAEAPVWPDSHGHAAATRLLCSLLLRPPPAVARLPSSSAARSSDLQRRQVAVPPFSPSSVSASSPCASPERCQFGTTTVHLVVVCKLPPAPASSYPTARVTASRSRVLAP
ncbi:hypothetical protein Taro_011251 [Colocasia esculenta]|uniref:Uncharacterized protein n=1 Tax=Colocasia esculenta TaxID=4460 RepID=A0A843U5T8_COLES|nr:hypothetical protein [Colocasia esculenta]